jgi:hypothetical protein
MIHLPKTIHDGLQRLPTKFSESPSQLQPGFYQAQQTQDGFDNVYVMEDGRMMFVECRYSNPPPEDERTGTRLAPTADICRKVSLVKREINQYQKTVGGLLEKDCVVVISAFRDPANKALSLEQFRDAVLKKPEENASEGVKEAYNTFRKFEGSVLVLDRAAVLEHCGPTLSRLGGFVLDSDSRH